MVAQKAATLQLLSDGRFTLGLGAGENLNEHVVGGGWPMARVRHEMLEEAVEIIRALFDGGYVDFRGVHFEVEAAKLWDRPDPPPRIGIAVSGPSSCQLAGAKADLVIAVEPDADLLEQFDAAGGDGKPRVGQVPICWDADAGAARRRAHEQFRWFAGGWSVNAELPGPVAFDAAAQSVTEEAVGEQIPCGPDVDAHVEAVKAFVDAGFTHVAVVQIGGEHQEAFTAWAGSELLPRPAQALSLNERRCGSASVPVTPAPALAILTHRSRGGSPTDGQGHGGAVARTHRGGAAAGPDPRHAGGPAGQHPR